MVVAHRGASSTHPENTLEAFEAALSAGADAVEFDVRLTRDDSPVVLHDPDVSRTTDGRGLVKDLTLSEVRGLRIRGASGVPRLQEALELLSGRAAADIEIKNLPGEPDFTPDDEPVVEAVLAAIDAALFSGPVLVSSFNPASIAASRRMAPEVPTALLTEFDVDARIALAAARDGGHPWILPFAKKVFEAGPGFAQEVHEAGLRLGVWLVDEPEPAADLMRSGADAVATNNPAAIVAVRREALGL